ncbi:hypothetical protein BN1356_00925 [Streptococcus varani]|uniref:Phage head-tail adapter protein n=1 Tax=Streptococcus varani TaxID=1608583 RepID=A0A0E4H3M3_9STRE|nr:phage head-tail adapter protein [Streptococcus varani]CQR24581.1 hypothetical protein BN1356_00925 [Streptococcus varani]
MARRETTNGDLRTPVVFYSATVKEGLDGRDTYYKEVFKSFASVYHPSMKDLEISGSKGTKASFTIKIRDPLSSYIPDNSHYVEIQDLRLRGKKWSIVDIRPSFDNRQFLTISLGGDASG